MWCNSDDLSEPIITANNQIHSAHRQCDLRLPKTAIVFFMSKGTEYLCKTRAARELPEAFPRFLNRCPIWELPDRGICFLDGGRGAPQACDTVETLAALGVQNVLAVGMFGAFDPRVSLGEILAPEQAFTEEGTSLHYYETIEFARPDADLLQTCVSTLQVKSYPIVSTDAVYRQTFRKEALWREKGAVGVDMETSAVFSVSAYLGVRSAAILMASDLHPLRADAPRWDWQMTTDMRHELAEKSLAAAIRFANEQTVL